MKVRGSNRVGFSPFSTPSSVNAATVPAAPNAPTRVPGTNTQTTITITWTPNNNGGLAINDYQVWWNSGGAGPVTGMLADLGSTSTTYIATGLSAGVYYSFAIKASNTIGFGDLSPVGSFISATKPDAPVSLAVVS